MIPLTAIHYVTVINIPTKQNDVTEKTYFHEEETPPPIAIPITGEQKISLSDLGADYSTNYDSGMLGFFYG